ncbi:hypothetical protein BC826DRAFT_1109770 [Russula brevipes]|nr:hypothetical protein BC826DRAFT_1109770 [Russula brevipes]
MAGTSSAQEERTTICIGSGGTRNDPCDSLRSTIILPAVEHIRDPRNFYALDSPVLSNSNSEEESESYESAWDFEERLEPEDNGGRQVGGSSAGLHSGLSRDPKELHAQRTSLSPQPSQPPSAQSTSPSRPQQVSGGSAGLRSRPSRGPQELHAQRTFLRPQPARSLPQTTSPSRPQQHKVAHCDLKLGNVVVDTCSPSPELFIIDFDLAEQVEGVKMIIGSFKVGLISSLLGYLFGYLFAFCLQTQLLYSSTYNYSKLDLLTPY